MELFNDHIQHKIKENYINILEEKKLTKNIHYEKTINLWGKNINKKNKTTYIVSDSHIEKVLLEFPIKNNIENYLEIGCGEGLDLLYISKNFRIKNTYALDIGENIYELSKMKKFKNIFFCRCDCLDLPLKKDSFDLIYSFGVFHHTVNINLALKEAKKVLKQNGTLIFYNYVKHKNFVKRFGVLIEGFLLKILNKKKFNTVKFICYLISPIILLIFSYPAQFLKLFGSKVYYKKFPLWWGIKPKDIIDDLLDRLYAPINIRLSKTEMINLLNEIGFSNIEVKEVRDGLYCKVVK